MFLFLFEEKQRARFKTGAALQLRCATDARQQRRTARGTHSAAQRAHTPSALPQPGAREAPSMQRHKKWRNPIGLGYRPKPADKIPRPLGRAVFG